MENPGLHELGLRLERLERELRWWRVGALGAVVLLLSLGAAPRGTTLEAERLVIRDAKGTVRAVLGSETVERGWSRLPDYPGAPLRFSPGLPKPAPQFGLYIYTEQGAEAARLNVSLPGDPQLVLIDSQQRSLVSIYAVNWGTGMRTAAGMNIGADMKTREEVMAKSEALSKRAEREKWTEHDKRWREMGADSFLDLAAATDGSNKPTLVSPGYKFEGGSRFGDFVFSPGQLTLFDKDGQSRAVLGRTELETVKTGTVEQRAESSLVLFDRDGKVLWQAP